MPAKKVSSRPSTSPVAAYVAMEAFGLYDANDGSLLLSRDRLGVKPLYLHQTAERLVFASEIKGIVAYLRHMREPVRANEASIATYAATGLVDGLEDTFSRASRASRLARRCG